MCIAFLVITGLISLKRGNIYIPTIVIAAVFFIMELVCWVFLKPVYIIWMKLAFGLAWINTRLILFIMFYLVFTPIGLIMRIFRIDLLDRKIDKYKDSYWVKIEDKNSSQANYERQF
ncbi:hypothetical protein D4R78_04875 [bacterium]|nr:MAG: hypothetical protein D4R78_04875 [bacterium]